MTDQTIYTETEQEIIVLRAVWDLIDVMVNYEVFEKDHGTIDAQVRFKTASTQKLFNIHLADFLSKPEKGVFGLPESTGSAKTDHTFLFYLRHICNSPKLNSHSVSIQTPTQQFIDWLEGECFVEKVWFSSIKVELDVRVKRLICLKICGNIAKHNFARLGRDVEEIIRLLDKNGVKVDLGQGFLALEDFNDWFHSHVLEYHCTTIAEYLNNIRWGIFEYLKPEFSRSFKKTSASKIDYRFEYPADCHNELAKVMYWELMNRVRSPPYFPRFQTIEILRKRF